MTRKENTGLHLETLELRQMLTTALADVDADGDLDVLLGSTWYENYNGAGDFAPHELGIPDSGEVILKDIDADGDLDLITSEPKLYSNQAGRFMAVELDSDVLALDRIKVIDLENDDQLDIVGIKGDRAYVFKRVDSAFREISNHPKPQNAMDVDDVDGDGDLDWIALEVVDLEEVIGDDLTTRNVAGNRTVLKRNLGNDQFENVVIRTDEIRVSGSLDNTLEFASTTYDVQLGDFDTDGRVDVIRKARQIYFSSTSVSVYKANTTGGFGDAEFIGSTNYGAFEIVDLDFDNDLDQFITDVMVDTIGWRFNDRGNFSDEVTIDGLFRSDEPGIAVGDIDSDGQIDLLTSGRDIGGIPRWYSPNSGFHVNLPIREYQFEQIDSLQAAIKAAVMDDEFDYDLNGLVDRRDLLTLLREKINSTVGDSNLDGIFDSSDLVQVFGRGEYEDQVKGNSTWRDGDWNGDGEFSTSDLVVAFGLGEYVTGTVSQLLIGQEMGINRFDASTGEFVGQFADTVSKLIRIIKGPDDQFYASGHINGASHISRFDGQGNQNATIEVQAAGWLSFGPDGDLYMATGKSVERFSVSPEGITSEGTFITTLYERAGPRIAFGTDGRIYSSEYYGDGFRRHIVRYDTVTGDRIDVFASGDSSKYNTLLFGADGFLYADDGNLRTIERFDIKTGISEAYWNYESNGNGGVDLVFGDDEFFVGIWESRTFHVLRVDAETKQEELILSLPSRGPIVFVAGLPV